MALSPPTNIGMFRSYQNSYSGFGSLSTNLSLLISNIIGFITLIAGLAFIMYFMIGAINWTTSSGDTTKAQKARSVITNALIGLVITVLAYPTALIVSRLLGVPLAEPNELLYYQLIF